MRQYLIEEELLKATVRFLQRGIAEEAYKDTVGGDALVRRIIEKIYVILDGKCV